MGYSTYWNASPDSIDLTHLAPAEWDALTAKLLDKCPQMAGAQGDFYRFTVDGEQIIECPDSGEDIRYGYDEILYGAVLIAPYLKPTTTRHEPDRDGYARGDTDIMLDWDGEESEDKGYIILTPEGVLECPLEARYPVARTYTDTTALDADREAEAQARAEFDARWARECEAKHAAEHVLIEGSQVAEVRLDLLAEHLRKSEHDGGHSLYTEAKEIKPSQLIATHERKHVELIEAQVRAADPLAGPAQYAEALTKAAQA